MEKPKNINEYKVWLHNVIGIPFTGKEQSYYETVSGIIKTDIERSAFWTEFINKIESFNNEYYLEKDGYHLTVANYRPEILVKSYDSMLNKAYRKNVILNRNWPGPPKDDWINSKNWLTKTNDIIRTSFVVKYLDGIEFMIDRLTRYCKELGLKNDVSFEARDEGYYAVHYYIYLPISIPNEDWISEKKTISFEIQLTTQLQDVIKKLTHLHYENRRVRIDRPDKKWQWNYKSEEFSANYLGHILHYIEGMIMEIRENQTKKIEL